jgi:outer membrane protein
MTTFFRYSLMMALALCVTFSAQAQKFGYTNSQAILMELPDVKRADSRLETLQKQLQSKGEQMVQTYQAKGQDLQKRANDGVIAQVQYETEAQALAIEEKKILKYEQDMMKQLSDKRAELIQPILKRVQNAIDAVADEKGYQYIFDMSTGVLLYAKDEDDITAAVKAKLGM